MTTESHARIWSNLAIPAGQTLAEELEARSIDRATFAKNIGVSLRRLGEICDGRKPITADIALSLEAELGIDAVFWMNLQNDYDLTVARNDRAKAQALPR